MPEVSDVEERGVRWASGTTYAIIPEWIIDSEISHAGVRLYAILARYANHATGEAWPGRKKLAERMRCSLDTVDRALADLEEAGAIEIVKRLRDDGGFAANLYVLRESAPTLAANEGYPLSRTDAASRTRASSSNEKEHPPVNPPTTDLAVPAPANRPTTVAKKRVTDGEYDLALAVLIDFNLQTESRYTSADWIAKIISRIREHPDVAFAGHRSVIQRVLRGKRWWDGDPSPSIVYGNAALFERNLHAAARPPDQNRPLTADEVRAMGRAIDDANVIEGQAVEQDACMRCGSTDYANVDYSGCSECREVAEVVDVVA